MKYTYDVFDRRIGKAVDTTSPFDLADAAIERYVYDDLNGVSSVDGGNVVLDFVDPDGSGSTGIALESRQLYANRVDQILAKEDVTVATSSADRVQWPLVDNLGTVRDLVENDGALGEHYTYESYGQVISGDTSVIRYLYTSREHDPDTGLQYNRARWYDAAVGRWISQDPIGFAAGDGNLSRYVGNRATDSTDPSGLVDEGRYEQLQQLAANFAYYAGGGGVMGYISSSNVEQTFRAVGEIEDVYTYSRAADASVARALYNSLGTAGATMTGVRDLTDWWYGDDAVDAHKLTAIERSMAGVTGVIGVGSTLFGGVAIARSMRVATTEANALANSVRTLPVLEREFIPDTRHLLQNVTNQGVDEITRNPAIARDLLSVKEYAQLAERTSLADATWGKAVERQAAQIISEDEAMSRILEYKSRPFVSTPDFIGYEGPNIRMLDITTSKQEREHLRRWYGQYLDFVTHAGLPRSLVIPE